MQFSRTERIAITLTLFALAIASRFLPHPPNFTALTAVMFASTMYLGPRTSVALLATILLLSDLLLGGYSFPVMLAVYGSFLLGTLVSLAFARIRSRTQKTVLFAAPALLFFAITNAVVWYVTPWYPKGLGGLIASYTLGLPFLGNMLAGDLVYGGLVFGVLAYYCHIRAGFISTPSYAR